MTVSVVKIAAATTAASSIVIAATLGDRVLDFRHMTKQGDIGIDNVLNG